VAAELAASQEGLSSMSEKEMLCRTNGAGVEPDIHAEIRVSNSFSATIKEFGLIIYVSLL
jgi:hypothetical protein